MANSSVPSLRDHRVLCGEKGKTTEVTETTKRGTGGSRPAAEKKSRCSISLAVGGRDSVVDCGGEAPAQLPLLNAGSTLRTKQALDGFLADSRLQASDRFAAHAQ